MGERTENMMDTTFETSHDQVMSHYPLLNLVRHPEWNGHLATLECLLQSYTILVGLYQREAGNSNKSVKRAHMECVDAIVRQFKAHYMDLKMIHRG